MGFSFSDNSDFEAEANASNISVTPLIDIIFALLLFFVLTTSFLKTNGTDINLPKSSTSPAKDVARDLIVGVSSQGEIFAENKKVSLEELSAIFSAWQNGHSTSPTLVIWGDKAAQHGLIVSVMDKARFAGISSISIATAPQVEPQNH